MKHEFGTIEEYFNGVKDRLYKRIGGDFNVIFSSFEPPLDVMIKLDHAGINFRTHLGKYKDEYEVSYMTTDLHFSKLFMLGILDGQESFLVYNEDTLEAYLLYNKLENGELKLEKLGVLGELNDEQKNTRDAWTLIDEHYVGLVA